MKRSTSLAGQLAIFLTLWAIPVHAATRFVSSAGSDSNSCTTAASPCLTVNSAYQKSAGGDIIEVAGGNYGNQVIQAGSKSSDIIVRPAQGQSVTLADLSINGATHVEFRDMTVTSGWSVRMNSNFVTFRNIIAKNAIFIDGGSNITTIGGSIGPGIDTHSQIAPANGWQGQGVNIVFDGVFFHDFTRTNSAVHIECLQVAGTTNMVIRNSKFQRCDVFDLSFTEYNNSGKVTNLLLENNWFDDAGDGGFFAVNMSQFSGGTSRFNSSTQGWVIQGTNPIPMAFIGNNIVGGIPDGNVGGCSPNATYQFNVTQGIKCGATDKNAAPGFVNGPNFDLNLAAGSGAIDFVPASVGGPSLDINGFARPFGLGFDAGASEFGSSAAARPDPPTALQATVR